MYVFFNKMSTHIHFAVKSRGPRYHISNWAPQFLVPALKLTKGTCTLINQAANTMMERSVLGLFFLIVT